MVRTNIKNILIVIGAVALLVLSFFIGRGTNHYEEKGVMFKTKYDTVHSTRVDTVTFTNMITRYRPTPTIIDTVYTKDTITDETAQHIKKTYEENGSYTDTTCVPSASVDYSLHISTDNNDVDSVGMRFKINYPRITNTETITKEITKYKTRHFNHGIQLGIGYGIVNKKPDVFVGYGVQYNF